MLRSWNKYVILQNHFEICEKINVEIRTGRDQVVENLYSLKSVLSLERKGICVVIVF